MVSLIITARNEPADALQATLTGLMLTSTQHEYEIIVIDDASEEPCQVDTGGVIKVVRNPESKGTSRSRRLGAELAQGEVLVWMDAHMSFAPGWLDHMLEHAGSGAVLCSAFWNYGLTTCHGYGADFEWHGGRLNNQQRYPGFAVRHRTRFPGPGAVDVPMIIGGCYLMLRTTYQKLGGFSPLSRVRGGNEQDFSARAWISGVDVKCVTRAKVGHLWRKRFPYPVQFSQLEFNQLALVQTVFEQPTVEALDACFRPYPAQIQEWLAHDAERIKDWRRKVQARRVCRDSEFFDRFAPGAGSTGRKHPEPPRQSARAGVPQISFVVVSRDEEEDILAETIDGILATCSGYRHEIVIVDDGSLVPVSLERPNTRVLRNPRSIGVAQCRRKGAQEATGSILVWLDAHMHFAPDWLDRMLAHVDSRALLCAAWWDYELSRPLCWGADFVWCGDRDYKAGRSPGLIFRHRTQTPEQEVVEVPMVMGACYMAVRENYDHCGGFSPYFRTWGKSEQDISARMWMTGQQVKCVTGARVGHLSRPSFPYPVSWGDIEFNQAMIFRVLLAEPTLAVVDDLLGPLPAKVQQWLNEVDIRAWRDEIQQRRKMEDVEFFRRFVANAPECLKLGVTVPAIV